MIVKRIATNSPSAPARVAKRRDGHASRRTIATYAMTSIVGKTILVTGASQGIGLEVGRAHQLRDCCHPEFGLTRVCITQQFVRQFAQKGNNVIATVRTRTEDLDRLGLSAQVHILELDVSSPESIQVCGREARCSGCPAPCLHVRNPFSRRRRRARRPVPVR